MIDNASPFKGPVPLSVGDRLLGRDREKDGIYNLLCSSRIVLLHSPSGAGKTSLVQAGLLKRLKKDFDVWGPARLNESAVCSVANRFSASLIRSLDKDPLLASLTLTQYAAQRRKDSNPYLIIIDQFEEVLTSDPLNHKAIKEFFEQLGMLLQDASCFALFLMREDYLAALDPYRGRVPTQISNRFRLELLSLPSAKLVISGLTEKTAHPIDPLAVDKLAEELANVQVLLPDGRSEMQVGYFVEPVFLQVICSSLWSMVVSEPNRTKLQIDPEDIQKLGDVSNALALYYSSSIGQIAQGNRQLESAIRDWFGNKLITPSRHRALAAKEPDKTKLADEIFVQLELSLLIRREDRAGAEWFELSHDSLIPAVLRDNARWKKKQTPLEQVAENWAKGGRRDALLATGAELESLQKGLDPYTIDSTSREFLDACRLAEVEETHREQAKVGERRIANFMVFFYGMAAAAVLASYLFVARKAQLTDGLFVEYFSWIIPANIIGGLCSLPILAIYRRDQRMQQLLLKLNRKHRRDPSLQPLKPETLSAPAEPTRNETSATLGQGEKDTLSFVPYWILLAVAGSDGSIESREVNALFQFQKLRRIKERESVIEKFVDDPRPADQGLAEAAAILASKLKPAEANAFRNDMAKLAKSISAPSQPVNQSFKFVEAALAGANIANLRPGFNRYYKHSGLYSKAGLAVALVASSFVAFGFAYAYSWLQALIANWHWGFKLAIAFVFGLLIATISIGLSWFTSIRNPRLLAFLATSTALVAIYARWALTYSIVLPGDWWPKIQSLSSDQIYYAAMEALVVLTPALLTAWFPIVGAFCDGCDEWAIDEAGLLLLKDDGPDFIPKLTTQLEQGNVEFLEAYAAPDTYSDTANSWLSLSIESCPVCNGLFILTVSSLEATLDKGVRNIQDNGPIIEQLLINRRMAHWIRSYKSRS